jgi:hypothetical protein
MEIETIQGDARCENLLPKSRTFNLAGAAHSFHANDSPNDEPEFLLHLPQSSRPRGLVEKVG